VSSGRPVWKHGSWSDSVYNVHAYPGGYYFGTLEQSLILRRPTPISFFASTVALGSIPLSSLIVTILELIYLLLNAVRNIANADGHREYITVFVEGPRPHIIHP